MQNTFAPPRILQAKTNMDGLRGATLHMHGWLLHNLVEASFDLFRYLLLGDQTLGTTSTDIINELHESQFVVILSNQPRFKMQ